MIENVGIPAQGGRQLGAIRLQTGRAPTLQSRLPMMAGLIPLPGLQTKQSQLIVKKSPPHNHIFALTSFQHAMKAALGAIRPSSGPFFQSDV